MRELPSSLELSRPYFEREARLGRRVIFQWTPVKRWPLVHLGGGPGQQHPRGPHADCPTCSDIPRIEGIVFESEQAAQMFDTDRLGPECADCRDDHLFPSWEAAAAWLLETP